MAALNKAIDKQSLRALNPLGKLTPDKINDIISKSRIENLPAGRTIFRQGEDDGQTIYLLSGQIELSTTGKTRKQTIKGKSVDAKFPLADQIPRPATAKTKVASSLLYIDSSLLEILLDENPSGEYEVTEIDIADHATDWMMRFLQSQAFLKLPTKNIQKVLMSMEEIHVNKGDTIVQQGEEGDYYYIIKHGCCTVSRRPAKKADEIRLAKLVEGDGFGEEALISNSKRNATVTMQESGTLMRLKKNDFLSLLVTPLIKNVHLNSLKSSLYKNSIIIDIRTSNEFKQGSLDNAKHIPLSMIRLRIPTLDTSKQYLIYSDDKGDAKATTFLLIQHGIEGLVVLGSLQQTVLLAEPPEKAKKPISNSTQTPELKIVANDSAKTRAKNEPSIEVPKRHSLNTPAQDKQSTNPVKAAPKEKTTKLHLQAKKEAEQMLTEAEAIRLSAIQDASSLRDKIEKEEILKLRTKLEKTRNKAEAAIKKSEQLAKNIRQQAEQESTQLRQQARGEVEKIHAELNHLREQETQMKQHLEAEQEAEQARTATECARTMALREAEKTCAAADKAAAESKAIANRLTEKARAIEKEAEQARLRAEEEAKEIRQAALKEANIIKQNALEESEKIKKSATPEQKTFINHDNVFNLDDNPDPMIEPVQPYADEASVALKMAEEIKAKLLEIEEQRIENEQNTPQKTIQHKAKITRLDGKVILEGEEDIFIFKEPQKHTSDKSVVETEIRQSSSKKTQQLNEPKPFIAPLNELPGADTKPIVFNNSNLPVCKTGKTKKSILAIAASILLVIILSLVAYTTKIQINFTEVGARVNQDSTKMKEDKVEKQGRKEFREKTSPIKRKQ